MTGAFVEGATQALLPCSWTLLIPAFAIGLATRRSQILGTFAGVAVMAIWVAVAGWLLPPLWIAGIAFLAGGVLWWRYGATTASAAAVALGAAWSWQPCVGPELGAALTTAQHEPLAALGGLAAFVVGVVAVGMAAGVLVRRWAGGRLDRVGAVIAGLLGAAMVIGIYPDVASTFARWSVALWA